MPEANFTAGQRVVALYGRAAPALAAAGGRLRRTPSIRSLVTLAVTVLVPAAQLLAVGLCFLGGNYVSMVFEDYRWRAAVAAIRTDPSVAWSPIAMSHFLTG